MQEGGGGTCAGASREVHASVAPPHQSGAGRPAGSRPDSLPRPEEVAPEAVEGAARLARHPANPPESAAGGVRAKGVTSAPQQAAIGLAHGTNPIAPKKSKV